MGGKSIISLLKKSCVSLVLMPHFGRLYISMIVVKALICAIFYPYEVESDREVNVFYTTSKIQVLGVVLVI